MNTVNTTSVNIPQSYDKLIADLKVTTKQDWVSIFGGAGRNAHIEAIHGHQLQPTDLDFVIEHDNDEQAVLRGLSRLPFASNLQKDLNNGIEYMGGGGNSVYVADIDLDDPTLPNGGKFKANFLIMKKEEAHWGQGQKIAVVTDAPINGVAYLGRDENDSLVFQKHPRFNQDIATLTYDPIADISKTIATGSHAISETRALQRFSKLSASIPMLQPSAEMQRIQQSQASFSISSP